MNWTLLVSKSARRQLENFPSRDQQRIEDALDAMEADPFGGDIKRLQPSGWRRRVGSYRIFYDLHIDERQIVVTAIVRRTSTTYENQAWELVLHPTACAASRNNPAARLNCSVVCAAQTCVRILALPTGTTG